MRLAIAGPAVSCAVSCIALTGCGGGQPATHTGQPAPHATSQLFGGSEQQQWPADRSLAGIHACQLIPAATIAQTLGQLEEQPTEAADGLACFYNTRFSSEDAGPSYILTIVKRSAYEAAKTIADSEAEAHLLHLAPVSGIGDEGFATSISTGGPSYDVTVAKGGAAAEIQVNSVMSASEQHAERLVALAVAKL